MPLFHSLWPVLLLFVSSVPFHSVFSSLHQSVYALGNYFLSVFNSWIPSLSVSNLGKKFIHWVLNFSFGGWNCQRAKFWGPGLWQPRESVQKHSSVSVIFLPKLTMTWVKWLCVQTLKKLKILYLELLVLGKYSMREMTLLLSPFLLKMEVSTFVFA